MYFSQFLQYVLQQVQLFAAQCQHIIYNNAKIQHTTATNIDTAPTENINLYLIIYALLLLISDQLVGLVMLIYDQCDQGSCFPR